MEPPTKWNLEGFLVGGFPPILHNLNLSALQSLLQWLLAKLHKLAHRGHLPVVRLAPLDLLIQVQVDLVDQTQHGSAVDIMDIGAGPSAGGNPSAPSSKSSRLAMYSWQQISVGFPKILILPPVSSSPAEFWAGSFVPPPGADGTPIRRCRWQCRCR